MPSPSDKKHIEVMCFGESIVDFLPNRRAKLRDVETFRKIVGGAPANVALGIARLGRRSALMCKVGADEFGSFLTEALAREGVDVAGVVATSEADTGFTFISLTADGERSFTAPRFLTADQTLCVEDIDPDAIRAADIVLFGTNQMIDARLRECAMFALETAKAADRLIVMDPNIRLHLWPNQDEVVPAVNAALAYVDVVKLNDEEIEILGPGMTARELYHDVLAPMGATALIATHASGGAEVFCGDLYTSVEAPNVDVVDTTGAGDGFVAGVLTALCELTDDATQRDGAMLRDLLRSWDAQTWKAALDLGCFVGSHVCTTLGATTGLPMREDVPWDSLGFSIEL